MVLNEQVDGKKKFIIIFLPMIAIFIGGSNNFYHKNSIINID